jgi:polysaccharide export outer membrane protein
MKIFCYMAPAILLAGFATAQQGAAARDNAVASVTAGTPAGPSRASYILGPGDEISVWVLDLEEINKKPIRIENDGYISLPLVGRIRAAGVTVEKFEGILREKLKSQILEPQVTIGLMELRSQPVSVIGSVNHPGVLQVQGSKSLVEVLSMAEGLRPDAGRTITVTRKLEYGKIPLRNATEDPTHQFSIAKIDFKEGLLAGESPEMNIAMKPYDVVSVPKADLVYVIGEVHKAGGFVLNDREALSVLQALSMAEGLNKTASPGGAKILRASASGPRTEIPIDLKKVLSGKGEDIRLQPNDILFVPNSASKSAAIRGLQTALEIGTGVVIWRH